MNLSEIKVPAWLAIHRHAEEIMDRIDPIPTAIIPPPDTEQLPVDEHSKIFTDAIEAKERAQLLVTEYRQREKKLETGLQEAIQALKEASRDGELKDLRIAQLENNMAILQSQAEELQWEVSNLRALEGSAYRLARHLVAEYERAEIEMPKRKQRNGKTPEVKAA